MIHISDRSVDKTCKALFTQNDILIDIFAQNSHRNYFVLETRGISMQMGPLPTKSDKGTEIKNIYKNNFDGNFGLNFRCV